MAHDLNGLKEELYTSFNSSMNRANNYGIHVPEQVALRKAAAETALAIVAVEHEITDATKPAPMLKEPAPFMLPVYHPPRG